MTMRCGNAPDGRREEWSPRSLEHPTTEYPDLTPVAVEELMARPGLVLLARSEDSGDLEECARRARYAIRTDEEVDHAYEAIYYLRHWLRIACGRANEFLEMQLSEALGKA